LTLRYATKGGLPTYLNFWVMTQDSVRHLVQGGMAQELNLAVGLPVAGEPGVYRARLRMAQNLLYTVVVFSEGMTPADYTLSVQGGILVDRYDQTREAQLRSRKSWPWRRNNRLIHPKLPLGTLKQLQRKSDGVPLVGTRSPTLRSTHHLATPLQGRQQGRKRRNIKSKGEKKKK